VIQSILKKLKKALQKTKTIGQKHPKVIKTKYGKKCAVFQIHDPQFIATFRVTPYSVEVGDFEYIFKIRILPGFEEEILGEFDGEVISVPSDLSKDGLCVYEFSILALFPNGASRVLYCIYIDSYNPNRTRVSRILGATARRIAYKSLQVVHDPKNGLSHTWRSLMAERNWLLELSEAIAMFEESDPDLKNQHISTSIVLMYQADLYY